MGWVYLMLAGLCEICWALGLQMSDGFTRLLPLSVTVIGLIGSIVLLNMGLKTVSFGTAYIVWTAIGTIGTATLGILMFGEAASVGRLACMALIIAGTIGLKMQPSTIETAEPAAAATQTGDAKS